MFLFFKKGFPLVGVLICLFFVGCGDDSKEGGNQDTQSSAGDTSTLTDTQSNEDSESEKDTGTGAPTIEIITELPDGFTTANPSDTDQSKGGYKVIGPLLETVKHQEDAVCGNVLRVVARDFQASHDDFQDAQGEESSVNVALGDDRKPVPSDTNTTKQPNEWYRNVDGVNMPFAVDLWLEPQGETFVFDTGCFFPLDGLGFEETAKACCDEQQHNFHFTTELHSKFKYKGGETFTFIGDDDVFVYINNQLVVDLGGIHAAVEGSVVLDDVAEELKLEKGKVYNFDLFQAERQTCGSNFRIETTLDFTGCGEILENDIVVE